VIQLGWGVLAEIPVREIVLLKIPSSHLAMSIASDSNKVLSGVSWQSHLEGCR
jgi:hypothetical protein